MLLLVALSQVALPSFYELLSVSRTVSSSAAATAFCCSQSQDLDSQLKDNKEKQDVVTNETCNKASAEHLDASMLPPFDSMRTYLHRSRW